MKIGSLVKLNGRRDFTGELGLVVAINGGYVTVMWIFAETNVRNPFGWTNIHPAHRLSPLWDFESYRMRNANVFSVGNLLRAVNYPDELYLVVFAKRTDGIFHILQLTERRGERLFGIYTTNTAKGYEKIVHWINTQFIRKKPRFINLKVCWQMLSLCHNKDMRIGNLVAYPPDPKAFGVVVGKDEGMRDDADKLCWLILWLDDDADNHGQTMSVSEEYLKVLRWGLEVLSFGSHFSHGQRKIISWASSAKSALMEMYISFGWRESTRGPPGPGCGMNGKRT
jgi:hypothetical protein